MLLLPLFLLAVALRLQGLWWDTGRGFHPDERWVVAVAEGLALPRSPREALSPHSPLNPFWDAASATPRRFAYGHAPLYLLRLSAWAMRPLLHHATPALSATQRLTLVGRLLAVAADMGTLGLIWSLARGWGWAAALLAAGGWAVAWLPVQQAHFATVDSLLVLAVTTALVALIRLAAQPTRGRALTAGALVGFAVGIKASAGLLGLLGLLLLWVAKGRDEKGKGTQQKAKGQNGWGWGILGAAGAFAVTNPYALLDLPSLLVSLNAESGMVSGRWLYPYTQQFRLTDTPLYPLLQLGHWGLGWPLLAIALASVGWQAFLHTLPPEKSKIEDRVRQLGESQILLFWLFLYAMFLLLAFARFPRYALPLLPALFVLGGAGVAQLPGWGRRALVVAGVLGPTLLWTVALGRVYDAPHPWQSASEWIYAQVPPGARLVQEEWDHGLPIAVQTGAGGLRFPSEYRIMRVDPYTPDTEAKVAALAGTLAEAEWVVLASPRAWGVLPALPDFPVMRRYYRALFDGSAGYAVVYIERVDGALAGWTVADDPFTRVGLPGTAAHRAWLAAQPTPRWWNPGPADESFSVYDHPVVIVLHKDQVHSQDELEALLREE